MAATDDLLERSLRLLDESTRGSPAVVKSILRYSRGPNDQQKFPENALNRSRRSVQSRKSIFDSSITLNPGELTRILDGTVGSIKGTGFKGEVHGCDQLFREFLESAFFLEGQGLSGQVFDNVADYYQNCTNLLTLKCGSEGVLNSNDPDISWLETERNTWKLVYCLYQNRLCPPTDVGTGDELMETVVKDQSEKEVVVRLYKEDNVIIESQLVVDWLEKIAADQFEVTYSPKLGHFMDKTVAWENTLHQLQNENISYASSRTIVTNLDPDAPMRQNKPLHDLDMEDEARLLQQVFTEIRCGRLEQAHTLCFHAGQAWRAATLEGWRLHHDPNYGRPGHAEKLPVEGNPNRDIWKLCAWRLAEDMRAPAVARAVHGALCGHLQSLLAFCSGWEDLLWSYSRVLIDVRVEQEIRACCCYQKEYVPMPDTYWNYKMSLEDVFTELEASCDHKVSRESLKPERIVQKLLILNRIPELMNRMTEWIESDSCKPHFIRFLAHLVLVLRQVGQSHSDDIGDEILKAYVKVLVNLGDCELVAYYVATLPQEDQVQIYASYLETVTDPEERQICLKAAESVDLQVEAITQQVVENIRNRISDSQNNLNLLGETTEDDKVKVSALDWVVFYPQQRVEALWQTNALIRSFLAQGKLEAAQMAFNKIPADSIDLVTAQCQLDPSLPADDYLTSGMPVRTAAAVREYLCIKAYLDAQEGFSDWFQHYHNAKPVAPNKLNSNATFTEKVAHDHKMAQYTKQLDRWKAAMAHQTKCVKAQLYNVLVFPDGGWLVDNEPDDQLRQQQMKSLRSLCLPKIVLLLHTVLQNSGEYSESMQLADLVVSEQYELYKVYSKQQLGELLNKIGETSLSLLDNKRDPWGYSVSS